MEEQKKRLNGMQKKMLLAMAVRLFEDMDGGYCTLSEDKERELHKAIANRAFDKTMAGKLTCPYDE